MSLGAGAARRHTIKDLVHSYIDFDDEERVLIDSPWCQRLKRVRQNDVSSAVYPSMHGTRFEHSLGAMHLAGLCMEAALESSSDEDRATFLAQLSTELQGLEVTAEPAPAARKLARLYGLLHDIGHPPFSHLMESCLDFETIYPDDTAPENGAGGKWLKKWHEFNGYQIVRRELSGHPLVAVVAHMMKGELVGAPALYGIKSLIDSVIDADRMDFVLRDGLTSGGEFGHYGQERLVKSFRIYVDRNSSGAIREIFIRPSTVALSAVESLLQERYKIYRWVHFHPRVVMATAFFRHAFAEVTQLGRLEPWCFRSANHCAPDGFLPLSRDGKSGDEGAREKSPYILLGDTFVEMRLEEVLGELERGELDVEGVRQARLRAALRSLLLRERWAVPLWKRLDQYRAFDEELKRTFQLRILKQSNLHAKPLYGLGRYAMEATDGRAFLDEVQKRLNGPGGGSDWYLLECTAGFRVKGDDAIVSPATGVLHMLSGAGPDGAGLSAVAPALDYAWRRDIFLYAFLVSHQPLEPGPVQCARIDAARTRVAEALVMAFDEMRDDIEAFVEKHP